MCYCNILLIRIAKETYKEERETIIFPFDIPTQLEESV